MIFVATIVGMLLLWLLAWRRFRDPLHPLIYLLPMFTYIYGWMPLSRYNQNPASFEQYSGGDFNNTHHAIVILVIGCLVAGVYRGTRGMTRRTVGWSNLRILNPGLVRVAGIGLGAVAMVAWVYMIVEQGGLLATYGTAYGMGKASSGYILEAPYLGLPGAIFIFLSRVGRGMRPIDWALVAICVAPVFLHAMLGARRGPAFLSLLTAGGGYIYFMRKRVPLIVIAAAGLALGTLMLFLVSNRENIYIGSQFEEVRGPLTALQSAESNEYLISNATVRLTQERGGFYGAREFVWIVARIVPTQIWPTIYWDLPRMLGLSVNLWVNGGVDPNRILQIAGWRPSRGSAEGYVASLWLEFQYLAPLVSFAIGWFYGRMWANARMKISARVIYLLMAALSIYLVMQSLDPWLFRLLLLGIPAHLILKMVKVTPISVSPTGDHHGRPLHQHVDLRSTAELLHSSPPMERK